MKTNPSLYFAYGSNLNIDQMAHRCPNATPFSVAKLEGYALTFWHSGVATIVPAKKTDYVPGVIWRITDECETSLDRYEGYPHLYNKNEVTVNAQKSNIYTPMVYIMNEQYHQPCLPPYHYFKSIKQGYASFNLPFAKLYEALDNTKIQLFQSQQSRSKKNNFIR
jgi:gamma-glutamylcyclotransferase (GGCT)/AIG2-like uncharacterized protein YtfP